MQPEPDGMATLKAQLPADGAVKIFQVTDLLATGTAGTPGDNTGIGARRVDALVDIATTYSPTESSTSPKCAELHLMHHSTVVVIGTW
jgi:hypothetical protein